MAAKTQRRNERGYKPSDLTGAARSFATRGLPLLNPASIEAKYDPDRGWVVLRDGVVVKDFGSGHAGRAAATKYAAKLKAEKKNPPTRQNHHNEQAAVDAFREFHGRDPQELVEFDEHVKFPGRTAAIGELVKLKIKVPPGRLDGGRVVTLSGFKGALLTRHPRDVQLYVEGGDQSLDLEEFGISEPHGLEFLGEVTEVTYYTTKDHLGSEGGEANYVHKFGVNEETGERTERPLANYDVANEQIVISGGGYTIPAEGIDG